MIFAIQFLMRESGLRPNFIDYTVVTILPSGQTV